MRAATEHKGAATKFKLEPVAHTALTQACPSPNVRASRRTLSVSQRPGSRTCNQRNGYRR